MKSPVECGFLPLHKNKQFAGENQWEALALLDSSLALLDEFIVSYIT
jgi:hypothetical protein